MRDNLIRRRWTRYIAKKSKWSLFLDFLFIVLVVIMLIPTTRHWVSSIVIRHTMFQPRESKEVVYIDKMDHQWILEDLDGHQLTLKEVRHKVVFINFWATWCPPCVAELPSIQRLYEEYGDRLAFVLVSDEDPRTLNAFLKNKKYTFPVFHTVKGNVPKTFHTSSIPASFLISKSGRVAVAKKGAANWNGKEIKMLIDKLLKES